MSSVRPSRSICARARLQDLHRTHRYLVAARRAGAPQARALRRQGGN